MNPAATAQIVPIRREIGEPTRSNDRATRVRLLLQPGTSLAAAAALSDADDMDVRVDSALLVNVAAAAAELRDADVIIFEIDPAVPTQRVEFERFARDLAGSVPVIAAIRDLDVDRTRLAMRAAAADALAFPLVLDDVRQTVRAVTEMGRVIARARAPARRGQVVALVGAIGGSGVTSIATQLGILWAADARVCLIDFNVQFGTAALYLDLRPQLGLTDVIEAGARLDGELLRSIAVRHGSGLEVVGAPIDLRPLDAVGVEGVDRVLDAATEAYDIVLLELPAAWTEWSMHAIERSAITCLVTGLSVPGLHQAKPAARGDRAEWLCRSGSACRQPHHPSAVRPRRSERERSCDRTQDRFRDHQRLSPRQLGDRSGQTIVRHKAAITDRARSARDGEIPCCRAQGGGGGDVKWPTRPQPTEVPSDGREPDRARAPSPAITPAPAAPAATPAPELSKINQHTELKVSLHQKLIERINLAALDTLTRDQVSREIGDLVSEMLKEESYALNLVERRQLVDDIVDEMMGLGPLEPLLKDPTISDIMVNGASLVFIERFGKIEETRTRFADDRHLLRVIGKIVANVGRRVDESSPMVDARLPDGSRINAIIPPLALDGPVLSIRKFSKTPIDMARLVQLGSMSADCALVLEGVVRARRNVLISGGTGSGKTTMLNAMSSAIDGHERVVTIEDSAELQLQQRHVVRLETRPANIEGRGEIAQRELLKNALRMRPDRIILGEIRSGEAFDVLQAMNTGHDGSMTTVHANTARDALSRVEQMVGMAGLDIAPRSIRNQIASAVQIVLQLERLSDGSRRLTSLSEVTGMEGDVVLLQEIFRFERLGIAADGKVIGSFRPTGVRPNFMRVLNARGIDIPQHVFNPFSDTQVVA